MHKLTALRSLHLELSKKSQSLAKQIKSANPDVRLDAELVKEATEVNRNYVNNLLALHKAEEAEIDRLSAILDANNIKY